MAKIEQHRITAIKRAVSLLNWIESDAHELKQEGRDYVMACVFHEDKTPSLKITPHKNLYHCFGCGASGSIIDWVMHTQSLDFRSAVEHIEQQQGGVVKTAALVQPGTLAADITNSDSQTALQGVIDYYHDCLKTSPEALAYLDSRGLNDPDLINTFKLGFSNKTLTSLLAAKHTQTGQQQRQILQASGALKESGYDHFAGCVVVPVYEQGQCVGGRSQRPASRDIGTSVRGIYGRRIQKYSEPKHLYLPGPHAGVWNVQGFKNTDTIILCEALIDAMTFWVNGFKHVTASYGTNGFTADHLKQIKDNNITKVLIAYDRDKGGDEAAAKLAEKLSAENIHCYRVNFPKNMDANSYALQVQPARKSLALVINKAEPMLDAPHLRSEDATARMQEVEQCMERLPRGQRTDTSKEKTTETTQDQNTQNNPLTVTETDLSLSCGNRTYRVRGLQNNTRLDQLKINLLVMSREGRYAGVPGSSTPAKVNDDLHYVDHLDLYQAKARKHYILSAADELGLEPGVIKKDLGKLLLALEDHQEQQLNGQTNLEKDKKTELTTEQKKQALNLLTGKKLVQRIVEDINTLGVIGEDSNALVSYLACVSRKLDKPLAVMIQSTSAAGKSALMDSVLSLMPKAQQHKFAAMTGQSLYYMGEMDLKHTILAIAEEEGVHTASYALKLLQSEGEVSIASTGKNETTGNLETKTYQVEGPVMLMMTTTAIDIDEELMNRCLVLSVNESRDQTQAIHALQRKKRTLEGLKQKVKTQALIEQHHHAQQLLKPLAVINPYAEQLTFLSDKTRTRRDHEKYLTLIDSIALLHQFQREIKVLHQYDGQEAQVPRAQGSAGATQREIKHLQEGDSITEYVEVSLEDIEIANQLAHDVLGRSLDELPPQTRKLLNLISDMVKAACKKETIEQSDYRFSRKQIRDTTGWGNTQIRIHCDRLVDMEYLIAHRGQRGTCFEYELLYQHESIQNGKTLMKLIDVKTLKTLHTKNSSRGTEPELAGSKRPQNGQINKPQSPPCQGLTANTKPSTQKRLSRAINHRCRYTAASQGRSP